MDGSRKPLKRREFLKKGIISGAFLAASPTVIAIPPGRGNPGSDSVKLLRTAQRFGAEFGGIKGGH